MMSIGRWMFRAILVIGVATISACPLPFTYSGAGPAAGHETDPSSPHITKPVVLAYSEQGGTSGTIPNGGSFASTRKTTIMLSTETEHAVIYYTSNGSPLTTLTSASTMDESSGTITLEPSTAPQTLDIYAMAIGPSMLPSTVVHAVVSVSFYKHIEKTAGTGIRDNGVDPVMLLTFLAVKAGTEDRSALEYNLTGLSYPVSSATLDIYISNLDPGVPDGVMDFYTYAGDGVIVTSEFSAGSLYTQVTSTGDSFSHVDFTAAVNAALQNGWTYLGVRISTATADRYWIGGSIVGLPEPILTVVQ